MFTVIAIKYCIEGSIRKSLSRLRDNVQVSFTIFVQIHEGASVTI
jgi:TolB-like protein